jgi:hypothetical protein
MCKLQFLKLLINKLIGYEFLKRFQGMYALNIIMQKPHEFYKTFGLLLQDHEMLNLKLRLFSCVMVFQGNRVVKFSF